MVGAGIQVETVLVSLLAVSLIALWRERYRAAGGCLGVSLGFILLLSVFPLGDFVLAPLEDRYPANPKVGTVAGIIVLGGGEEPRRSTTIGQPLLGESGERYTAAFSLAQRFPKTPILYTGWTGQKGAPRAKGPFGICS